MMQNCLIKDTDDDKLNAFFIFDRDEDNKIEIDELRFVLSSLSLMNSDELEECLEFYNLENNGKLSLESNS
jgi:Ca2+-binding EF-hand superfamily protein